MNVKSHALALGALAVALVVPRFASPYLLEILTLGFLFAYLSSAWNIVGGFGGQLSLGHALFFGAGSYALGMLTVKAGLPAPVALLAGPAVAALLAWVVGFVCFRYGLKGLFFAVATLLLAEIARVLVTGSAFFNRSQGLNLPITAGLRQLQFTSGIPYYYMVLALLTGCVLLVGWLSRTRFGYRLVAVREQEEGAEALGVDARRIKLAALVLSAALTGLGGVIHGGLVRFIQPDQDLGLTITLTMIVGALLGGRGTVWGPVVGGLALTAIQEGLSFLGTLVGSTRFYSMIQVFYGALLMLVIVFLPRGLVSVVPRAARSRR